MEETSQIALMMSAKHLTAADQLAAQWATNRSTAIRRAIEMAAKAENVWPQPQEQENEDAEENL